MLVPGFGYTNRQGGFIVTNVQATIIDAIICNFNHTFTT